MAGITSLMAGMSSVTRVLRSPSVRWANAVAEKTRDFSATAVAEKTRDFSSSCSKRTSESASKSLGIVGMPYNRGQTKKGVENGPKSLRSAGLMDHLNDTPWKVNDYGDLGFDKYVNDEYGGNMNNPRTTGNCMRKISRRVKEIREENDLVLSLGGDHSIAIGSIHGHMQHCPNACVVWVDAHADINAPGESGSGNIHGMPLAFLLDELKDKVQPAKDEFKEWEWLNPCLHAKDIVYIGLRDVDKAEREELHRLNIKAFTIYDIDKYGIAQCVKMAMNHVNPNMDRPIHVSYDIDVLDPSIALQTGTPVIGGLTVREGFFVAEELAATGCLSAVDLVEVNPALHLEEQDNTIYAANKIIGCFLGTRIL